MTDKMREFIRQTSLAAMICSALVLIALFTPEWMIID